MIPVMRRPGDVLIISGTVSDVTMLVSSPNALRSEIPICLIMSCMRISRDVLLGQLLDCENMR